MRTIFQEDAILETSRFVFPGVANDVPGVRLRLSGNAPLFCDRKTGTAAAAQAGSLDLFEDVVGYGSIAACGGAVVVEGFEPGWFAFGKENHDMRRSLEPQRHKDPGPPELCVFVSLWFPQPPKTAPRPAIDKSDPSRADPHRASSVPRALRPARAPQFPQHRNASPRCTKP